MAAGGLRARLAFERSTETADGAGGTVLVWGVIYSCRGRFMPERGRERIEAGRTEAAMAGVLRIRSSIAARALSEADRVRIDDDLYQILSISNPDQRNKFLELSVERGTGS